MLFILIRSIYRVVELSGGFHSKLANQQAAFIILESTMILLATLFMTVMHPGEVFSEKVWKDAGWPKKDSLVAAILREIELRAP
jgi:hypothetical protein